MPKTVQIRDLDDATYAKLSRRAAEAGLSVPELLRRYAKRLVAQPTIDEWLQRTNRRQSDVTTAQALEVLDEWRGPWPA